MENITYVTDVDEIKGTITETVLIDLGNGEFISMLKSTFDEQQAALAEQTKPTK